jgi:hypothetical protein
MKVTKWRICPRCEGEGTSSAYLGDYTAEEFNEAFDPEEQERYFEGGYDRTCEQCNGTGKVNGEDEKQWNDRRADLYQQWLECGRPEGSFSKWSGC